MTCCCELTIRLFVHVYDQYFRLESQYLDVRMTNYKEHSVLMYFIEVHNTLSYVKTEK